ncbi:MAG: hypothetical protein IJO73_04785 [Clostridia bacterium]|nr:hypothetical protein [Clostridia bacterium]
MEILTALIELIPTLGFPIVCVIALGAFVFHIYKQTTKENAANMEKVQARCKEREEKLYEEIKENREVNAQAIATIAHYAEKLEVI